jgi:hypothetical protein
MPTRHARYLREKAKQLRQVAQNYRTGLSQQLLNLADEFDAKATEIELGARRNPPPVN